MTRVALLLVLPWLASCLIAESPSDFPNQPTQRPTIVQSRVVPSAGQVLGSFPTAQGGFIVPIKLLDPTQIFEWRVFLDFDANSLNTESQAKAGGRSEPGGEDVDATDKLNGIRRIKFSLDPPDDTLCHVIEFIVTSGTFTSGARAVRNVDPLQSDQITWFYSPGGDLAGCPVQNAAAPPYDGSTPTSEEARAD